VTGRISDRSKQRAPCTITLDGRRHSGFVLDLSRTGLFIQTSAKPLPGQRLDIELSVRGETLRMHVEVARRKQVPPQLLAVAHRGVGVRVLSAPEGFYQLLADFQAKGSEGSSEPLKGRVPASRAASTPPGRKASRTVRPPNRERPRTTPGPEPAAACEFRVRVKQVSGTRTRTLRIRAADEAAARCEVTSDLGDEWKILEVTPV
jgi:hypothetical protein